MSNLIVVEGIAKYLGRRYLTEFTNCILWLSDSGRRKIFGPKIARCMSEEELMKLGNEFEEKLNRIGIVRSGRIVISRK